MDARRNGLLGRCPGRGQMSGQCMPRLQATEDAELTTQWHWIIVHRGALPTLVTRRPSRRPS